MSNIEIIKLSSPNNKPMMLDGTHVIQICKDLYQAPKGIWGIIQAFLNKHKHIEKAVDLNIVNINIDPKLTIKDDKSLFSISYGTRKVEQKDLPLRIELNQLEEPFHILFNRNQIKDCNYTPTSRDLKTFRISYRLEIKDELGNTIDGKDENIDLQFNLEENEPKFQFIRVSENNPLQFKAGIGLQKIGSLRVSLPNTLKYAPKVDLKINLRIIDNTGKDVPEFLIVKSNGKIINCIDEKGLSAKALGNGNPTKVKEYDFYLDINKIANPMVDVASYTIIGDCEYKYSYQNVFQPMRQFSEDIGILKDKQETELVVQAIHKGTEMIASNGNQWEIPKIEFTSSNLTYPVKLTLKNKATDSTRVGAGLTIKNLQIRSITSANVKLYDIQQNEIPVTNVVTLNGNVPQIETEQGIFLANSNNSEVTFSVNFAPQNIYTIRKEGYKIFDLTIDTFVEFDYVEDALGNGQAQQKHFKGLIKWNLFKKSNPEWLSIDYGSSAIVCYYGKGGSSKLIDLRQSRTNVYKLAKKDSNNPNGFNDSEIKDDVEQNTPFLPSDILLHDVQNANATGLCSQLDNNSQVKYSSMAVILSPTKKISKDDFRRQLPCLKVLMGNKFLPDKADYRNFRYYYWDGDTLKGDTAEHLRDSEFSLLQIDNIFQEAYFTLFHYFIQDTTIKEQANKLVLTYPNTYTPRNLMTLRAIVGKTLPAIREVQFVSESDAVAAYYMDNWMDYHPDTDDIKKDENILVYDMGAGTLDITYLTKKFDRKSEKYTLEILGKIGTGRAGNYLDHVIAEILYVNLREDGFKKSWAGTDMKAVEQDILEARVDLKAAIKNKIKPQLDRKLSIKFQIGNEIYTIDPQKIVEDELFKEYLENVTTKIWNNIKKYVGAAKFKVDTVIMSGRSLRLDILQQHVRSLSKNATYIMLDEVSNGPSKNTKNDRSKTAVVEGAKKYAETYISENTPVKIRSRRLQASYGVAFKRTGGKWEYHELLGRNDIPFNDENADDEFRRPTGPLEITHTDESNVLLFIQTFLSEKDTQKALQDNSVEYISIMSEVMMSDLDNKGSLKLDVIVDRNNNVSLYADGMETPYKAPAGVDLENEITKNSLWPVSITNE